MQLSVSKPKRGSNARQSVERVPEVFDQRSFTWHCVSSSQFPRPLYAMILVVWFLNFAHRCNRTETGPLPAAATLTSLDIVMPLATWYTGPSTAEDGERRGEYAAEVGLIWAVIPPKRCASFPPFARSVGRVLGQLALSAAIVLGLLALPS